MRLRKWGTVITAAAMLHGGGGDPLDQALEYHDYMSSRADMAERANSITAPSRSVRSALPPLLLTIRANESGGDYLAVNSMGCDGQLCGGAYQLHSSYASQWAADAGYPSMSSNAATWPPATQDAVALYLFNSTNPSGWHWCQFTSYC